MLPVFQASLVDNASYASQGLPAADHVHPQKNLPAALLDVTPSTQVLTSVASARCGSSRCCFIRLVHHLASACSNRHTASDKASLPSQAVAVAATSAQPQHIYKNVLLNGSAGQLATIENNQLQSRGLDVKLMHGQQTISVHGVDYPFRYSRHGSYGEILIGYSKVAVPVYMEKLSKTWHLWYRGRVIPCWAEDRGFIRICKLRHEAFCYTDVGNSDLLRYGKASVYEARLRDQAPDSPAPFHVIEILAELLPVRLRSDGSGDYEVYHRALPERPGRVLEWDGLRWIFASAAVASATALKPALT